MWSMSKSWFVAPYLAMALVGCGNQDARYPVAGKVLIDGEPLPGGFVRFVPEEGRPATSQISSDGSFVLSQASVSSDPQTTGIPPGNYHVAVLASEVTDEDAGVIESLVPAKYADFRTSEIAFQIDRPRKDLVVALSRDIDDVTAEDDEQRAAGSSPNTSKQQDSLEK